ncbi:MAG: squalene synthase HpnC [Burkholderiaceae bacterium]
MPVEHYENFPVASVLLPRRLRPAVEAIYGFARSADDLADEGDVTPEARLAALNAYEAELDKIHNQQPTDTKLFKTLAIVVRDYELPLQPFRDLLSAFKQDVVTKRYPTYETMLDYCSRSANPVGNLMLRLYGQADTQNLSDSNAICSALQIINFWQDIAVDWQKDRIYLPLEDLACFGVTEKHLIECTIDAPWRALMAFEIKRSRELMLAGAPLALRLRGRIGWELRLVIQGGLRILERIEGVDYDIFNRRPKLGKTDWLIMAWRALKM